MLISIFFSLSNNFCDNSNMVIKKTLEVDLVE